MEKLMKYRSVIKLKKKLLETDDLFFFTFLQNVKIANVSESFYPRKQIDCFFF